MSRRLRSPEALGLSLHSSKRPQERAGSRILVLRAAPLGDYRWKELREEFGLYLRLFPRGTRGFCRCGHPKLGREGWVHVLSPLRGERPCQPPDGTPCDCTGWSPLVNGATRVVGDVRYVRSAANRAWKGARLPRFGPLEERMVSVYRFVQGRA